MGDFDQAFQDELARQSWALYSVGVFIIALRTYARLHRVGIKGFKPDDWLMLLVFAIYTVLIVCLNVIAQGGGSNLYEPSDFPTFSAEDIQHRIYGSKIVLVSEQAMLNVIYCIKACMLLMYSRLTLGLREQRAVVWLAAYVALGWIATELGFFLYCQPFSGYWAMPPPDPQCTTLANYAITQAVFNLSSDTLMLLIPIPLVIRMAVPWRQKIIVLVIFGLGVFVITAAILTKVFNLSDVWDPSYMLWYTREASVAVYVSNLPLILPLMREWFPVLRRFTPGGVAPVDTARAWHGAKPTFSRKVSTMGRSKPNAPANIEDGESSDEIDLVAVKARGHDPWRITKSTTVHIDEEMVTPDLDDDQPEGTRPQQKWDWNENGNNEYRVGAKGGI